MSGPEIEPELAAEVARIKRAAIRRRARVNRFVGALLFVAVVVAVVVWFIPRPLDRDDLHLTLAMGLGATVFCLGCIFGRFLFPIPRAECPRCACDWNVESECNVEKWLAWRCCPGCGLKMTDD